MEIIIDCDNKELAKAIKRARFLSLMSYTNKTYTSWK